MLPRLIPNDGLVLGGRSILDRKDEFVIGAGEDLRLAFDIL